MAWFINKPRKRGKSGKKRNARFKKGSKAAKAWGRKMRALRLGGGRKRKRSRNPLLTVANRKGAYSMAKKRRKRGRGRKKNRSYSLKGRPVKIVFRNRYRKRGRRRNALALRRRIPNFQKIMIQGASVIGGIAAPTILKGFLPPASSQMGMYLREAAAHLIPGLAATFVVNKSTSKLIWLGIGASALLTILRAQGVAVPGLSAGEEMVPVDAYAGAGELPMGSGDDNMPERLRSPLFAN